MTIQTTIPLTKDDRTLLTSYTNTEFLKEVIPMFCWAAFMLTMVMFVVLRLLSHWFGSYVGLANVENGAILFISAAMALLYATYYAIKEIGEIRNDTSGFQEKLQNDLRNNVKTVETLNVTQYAELEQYEDEGTAFLMALGDERLLCLRGQEFDDYAHDAIAEPDEGIEDVRHLFPQTQIEYSHAPETQIRLDVSGIGDVMDHESRWFLPTIKKTIYLMEGFYNGTVEEILEKHGYKRREQ